MDLSIKTDPDVYWAGKDDTPLEIAYAYINESNQAFYLASCLGRVSEILEKFVDGDWITAYAPACPLVLTPPIKIAAGSRHDATIQLYPSTWNPNANNASWKGGDIEGTYRITEKIYGEWDQEKFDNGTLVTEVITSNSFDIKEIE